MIYGFLCLIIIFCLWRFVFFFRNPARHIDSTATVVSPADGYVLYIKK